MKKNLKNVIWGILLIAAAVFVIVGKRMDLNVSVWSLIFTVGLVVAFVDSLIKLEWGGVFFTLAFLAIIYDDYLHITDLTPWPVLAAALLLTIGFNMLFHKSHFKKGIYVNGHKIEKGEYVDEETSNDEFFSCEVAFGSAVKYVNCNNLSQSNLENAFGNLTVYFDNARLKDGRANLSVDNAFGKTTIYIPKDWHVNVKKESFLGNINYEGQCAAESENVIYANLETAFGTVEIIYI